MTDNTTTTTQKVRLFWNAQGQVLCAKHAPARISDTWTNEQWQAVPEMPETAKLGCEYCKHAGGQS